jgi:nucleoside-diphosphate-sugar epimerase
MRVFVAGAAGAIGRQLISLLVGAGHDVTGTTRSTERAESLASAGARPIIVDAYDRDALRAAVADARPDVVVHELTDFARGFDAENLASNGRLREVGTRNLVDAAVAAGAGRLVAQSGAWLYADGPLPHDESHPLRNPTDSPDARGIFESSSAS